MKKSAFIVLLILLSIAYLSILKFQGFEIGAFSRANLFYVCLSLLVLFLILLVRSFKYWILLKAVNIDIGKEVFPTTVLGFYSNFVSPIRVSELVRSFVVKKKTNKPFFMIMSPTVIDSLIDITAMISIIVFFSLFVAITVDYIPKLFLIGVFLVFIFATFLLIMTKKGEGILLSVIKRISSRFLKKADTTSTEFIGKSREIIRNWKLIIFVFVLGLLIWLLEGLKLYFIVMASGLLIGLPLAVLIISIAYLIGGSLVNPSGITQEAVLLLLLLQLPFEKSSLMLAGSLDVLITIGTVLVLGTLFLLRFGVRTLKLSQI